MDNDRQRTASVRKSTCLRSHEARKTDAVRRRTRLASWLLPNRHHDEPMSKVRSMVRGGVFACTGLFAGRRDRRMQSTLLKAQAMAAWSGDLCMVHGSLGKKERWEQPRRLAGSEPRMPEALQLPWRSLFWMEKKQMTPRLKSSCLRVFFFPVHQLGAAQLRLGKCGKGGYLTRVGFKRLPRFKLYLWAFKSLPKPLSRSLAFSNCLTPPS